MVTSWVMVWGVGALVFAFFSSALAKARGHSPAVWFIAGLLFGPLGLVVGLFPVNQHILDARERGEEAPSPVAKVIFWIMVTTLAIVLFLAATSD